MNRYSVTFAFVLLASAGAAPAMSAQSHCPTGEVRAYSHNDYNNQHPLFDAVALGYRGVEVDVFLIDGVLRVAHDRRSNREVYADLFRAGIDIIGTKSLTSTRAALLDTAK